MRITHPWHVVETSPWPLGASWSAFVFASGLIMKLNLVKNSEWILGSGIILLIITSILWWKDVITEGTYQGKHTYSVKNGIKTGIILFFVSECFLFVGFFWAYFHGSLSPSIELGSIWPPIGINVINPWGIPILNIVILLSSGAFLTWAHEKLINGQEKETKIGLFITIILGFVFLSLQFAEYSFSTYTLADSVYGSSFFIITTTHMLHVIAGSLFLFVGLLRIKEYTKEHHLGLEAAIWYWHIVDIIFLFVFAIVYWWGSQ